MEIKVFLDTNIIIDYLVETRHKHLIAKEIVIRCYNKSLQGYISETVITNTAYVLRKMLAQSQMNFIFSGFCSFLDVLGISNSSVIKACEVNKTDLEDAILYHIALENDCQFFITSNGADFKDIARPALKVIAPEEFLEWFEKQK